MSDLLLRELSAISSHCPIVTAGHQDYNVCRKVWNAVVDRHPAAIIQPRNVDDVRRAVHAAAISSSLLAIRGGGHSFPGFSTCDGGLVIDLKHLNSISIDRAAGTVEVGGGALLGDLDRTTVPQGLIVPAGVISHTGVAGLTLGGGMGWSSRRCGLTIDSLLGAEIVTAAGDVVWASETLEPELFWGIRGGGGNFGVVTRFQFKLHSLGPVVVGEWNYPLANARHALRTLREQAHGHSRDQTISLTVTTTGLNVTALWSGNVALADAALSPLGVLADDGVGNVGVLPFLTLQSRNDQHFAWSRRYYSKGGFWPDITDEAIDQAMAAIACAPAPDCEIYAIQLGGAVCDVADDATAYSGRSAGYYWISESVWDAPNDDDRCIAWGRATGRSLVSSDVVGNYVNEQADSHADFALEAYGVRKYHRLARLKAKVDPQNLFRLNQNIAPVV